ncbi:hypothetical protein MFRU_017g01250 [Monilinia fructicola]|uniref:XPG N-terminal domain-containing protein n=1 Tax=Monilinia fructicola TaxID=38448 RepID=A0A5M9JJP5_MONFR|nr:hypothetical protein EYC84_007932 [Monilinia fructicola]KAG4029189.1 hypothetical protein MFRU_017g01250 [Monilinia fructicola]
MPLNTGDPLIDTGVVSMPFSDLVNAKIGVEATAYLSNLLKGPADEPLLAALGGHPMALKTHIENDLDKWKENDMEPFFVFEGQSIVGKKEMTMRSLKASISETEQAWALYNDGNPTDAVAAFRKAAAIQIPDLYHILQEVLTARDLEYMTAPFSACAQLAALDRHEEQYIDGIMGSQELLLYDISDAVIYPPSAADWENKALRGVVRSDLLKKLNVTPDMLSDALLMTGTSFLPPFPPLQDQTIISRQPYTVGDAVNLLRTSEKSVSATCAAFSDILNVRDRDWLDKYRKAKMGIKHCVTVATDGSIHIRDFDHLTGDNHEYLGLQLPAELYSYLQKDVIGPRLLNTFNSLEYHVLPTLDGFVSDEYRKLVTESLLPLKETSAALIAPRMHRGFLYKEITMRLWFDDNKKPKLNHKHLQPQTNDLADSWGVKDTDIKSLETKSLKAGKLSFAAITLLDNKDLPPKTIGKGKPTGLASKSEILSNSLWRLLHLRGYVNDKHELTNWGKALATTLKAVQTISEKYQDVHLIEEAAFLAFELIRFQNLHTRDRHPELIGGPLRGQEEDKANCILISRAACLLKIRHSPIGYTGPLSKNFLSYHSIIKSIRDTDRDLIEAIVASMLLSGQVVRNVRQYQGLGRSLPFDTDIDVGFGIAVKTYLDDYIKPDVPKDEKTRMKNAYSSTFLPHAINFVEDLDVAFSFFDALHKGVKTLSDEEMKSEEKKTWDDAKAYLELRR